MALGPLCSLVTAIQWTLGDTCSSELNNEATTCSAHSKQCFRDRATSNASRVACHSYGPRRLAADSNFQRLTLYLSPCHPELAKRVEGPPHSPLTNICAPLSPRRERAG